MADWFETRFREPVEHERPDPAFVARMRSLVVEEWHADAHDREGDLIMLQTEERLTQGGPTGPRRRPPGRWIAAAAAVVAVAVVGTLLAFGDGDEDRVDTASESGSPTTTTPPDVEPARDIADLEGVFTLKPARYFIDADEDDATPLRVTFEIAEERWEPALGAVRSLPGQGGYVGFFVTTVHNVVTDGCRDHSARTPAVGPTVDDLAAAFSTLAPFELVSPPRDVMLLGYPGKRLTLEVPELTMDAAAENYHDFADCVDGELHSWLGANNDGEPFYGYDGPGQREEIWILDVLGERLVLVKMDGPGAQADHIAERDAIFDSITIEP